MGILDDAIKEHLELKRRHGAGEPELKQLEDEAFGAAERPGAEGSPPDSLAEAPTQLITQPEVEEGSNRPAPRAEIADLQEAPPVAPEESAPEPEITTGPSTEEREAIAEQPTEMYDVEELSASQAEAPSEEELVEEGLEEPRLAPVDPLAGLDEEGESAEADAEDAEVGEGPGEQVAEAKEEYEEDDDFWDEKRLSDELDQALEAPSEADVEEEEEVFSGEKAEPEAEIDPAPEPEAAEDQPARSDEDVLEETPDFLEETPEDDQLWFEQKPPKDFDFDD